MGINGLSLTGVKQLMNMPHGIERTAVGPIGLSPTNRPPGQFLCLVVALAAGLPGSVG